MKTEIVDVNDTQRTCASKSADGGRGNRSHHPRRLLAQGAHSGFRPGKAPSRVIKQRFKDRILHDVVHDPIPRAVTTRCDARRGGGQHARHPRRDGGRRAAASPSPRRPRARSPRRLRRSREADVVAVKQKRVEVAMQRLRRSARAIGVEGAASITADTVTVDLTEITAASGAGTKHQRRARRGANPLDSTNSCSASKPARRRASTSSIPRTTRSRSSRGRASRTRSR